MLAGPMGPHLFDCGLGIVEQEEAEEAEERENHETHELHENCREEAARSNRDASRVFAGGSALVSPGVRVFRVFRG